MYILVAAVESRLILQRHVLNMDSTQLDISVVGSAGLRRGCGMKPAPRSAAAHGSIKSVPPFSSKVKRTAGSATTQRVQMSPPVCHSHPGKVLELRTSLGLSRARAILQRQPQEVNAAEAELGPGQRGRRGQLKSARLQPLMGVADPVLDPDSCLGIVPAAVMRHGPRNKGRKQRPRSSTVPGLHLDEQTPRGWSDSSKRVRVKRRSYSAIAARAIDTEKLLQLFSVTRSTGLVPQRLPESESVEAAHHPPTHGRILPPVVPHSQLGELRIKVEVRGLKKTPSHSPQSKSPRASPKKSSDAAPRDLKLPLITNSPSLQKSPSDLDTHEPQGTPPFRSSDSKQKTTLTNSGSTSYSESPVKSPAAANCTSIGNTSTSTSDGGIMRVSIVSLGEAEVVEEKSRGRNKSRKRQSSGKQSGRLSLGWSPPQPIEPLKGNPLLTSPTESTPRKSQGKTRDVGRHGDENGTGPEFTGVGLELVRLTSAVSSRPMSAASSNILSVNVSEFLQDDADAHVQY